jgi:hypothetical protein
MSAPRRLTVLALALGVALCAFNLTWGLAEGQWSPDEFLWVYRLDRRMPPEIATTEGTGLVYPTLFGYASNVTCRLAGGCAPATPDTERIAAALRDGAADPEFVRILLAARVTSALAWLAGALLVSALGRRLYDARVGAVAALLLATSPFAIMQVHCASVDPMLATMGVVTLLAAWRLATRPSALAALAVGLAAGLGFATKYTGLAFVCPALWAVIEAAVARRRFRAAAGLAALVVIGMAVGAALGCPPCVLHAGDVRRVLAWHHELAVTAPFDGNRLAESLGWYARPWVYQLVAALPYLLGVPAYLLAMAGIGLAFRRHTLADRLVLTLMLPYFAVVGGTRVTFPRQLLPLVPGLVLLAARAACALGARRPRLGSALLGATVLYSAALTATHVARLSWDQQAEVARTVAARVGNAAATTHVAFPGYGPFLRLAEPLHRAGLVPDARLAGQWLRPPAPWFVMPEWYATAVRRDDENAHLRADLASLEAGGNGYRVVARIPRGWYLQRPLDEWLDPALGVDLWQGAIGFTLYARDGAG